MKTVDCGQYEYNILTIMYIHFYIYYISYILLDILISTKKQEILIHRHLQQNQNSDKSVQEKHETWKRWNKTKSQQERLSFLETRKATAKVTRKTKNPLIQLLLNFQMDICFEILLRTTQQTSTRPLDQGSRNMNPRPSALKTQKVGQA